MSVAQTRLKEVTGHSPEVVSPTQLRRSAEILTGFTVGHRINKHGIVFGLDYAFKALGEAAKVPAIKDNSQLIARGISGTGSLLGVLMLRGKWSRLLSGGALFENVEAGIDALVEAVRKAVGSPK